MLEKQSTGITRMEQRAADLKAGKTIPAQESDLGPTTYDPIENGGVTPVVTPEGDYMIKTKQGIIKTLHGYLSRYTV